MKLTWELYADMLGQHLRQAIYDVLLLSDPGVDMPSEKDLHRYTGIIWTGCNLTIYDTASASAVRGVRLAGFRRTARRVAFCISLRLNNIRRWRLLGRVRGILGKFGYLFGKLSYSLSKFSIFSDKLFVGFEKFGNLFFQSYLFNLQVGNLLLIELFLFRCQFLSSRHLQQLLSGERGLPLEKNNLTLQTV